MDSLIGLAMLYVWVHSIVIVVKKLKEPTGYETGVLIAGAIGVVLFIMGTLGA